MRALVLSSGGGNGSFQAGVLKHLLGELGTRYDIISGSSVGALNGACVAQFAHGQEKASVECLTDLWSSVKQKDIYRKWYGGLLWYLPVLWKNSIYDSSPLWDLIDKNLDTKKIYNSGKLLRVGAVSQNTGRRRVWTECDIDLLTGIKASSAFPIAFCPVDHEGELWADDAIKEATPIDSAIRAGARTIDIIRTSPLNVPHTLTRDLRLYHLGKRTLDHILDDLEQGDLKTTQLYNRLVRAGEAKDKVYITIRLFEPPVLLGSSLDFSHNRMVNNMELGYRVAKRVIREDACLALGR